jgi:hypothetical protein
MRPKNNVKAFLRGRSGHGKAKPQPGRISALAAFRPLTSVYTKPNATPAELSTVVTPSILAPTVSGLWPGQIALQWKSIPALQIIFLPIDTMGAT